MDLPTVLGNLRIAAHSPAISQGWTESAPARPPGDLFFIEKDFITTGCNYLGLPPAMLEPTLQAADQIRANPALTALIWHAHYRLYRSGSGLGGWPSLTESLGDLAGLFYFIVLLSNYLETRTLHTAHAIPSAVITDSLSDIVHNLQNNKKRTGQYALTPLNCDAWLKYHLRGNLYQLGRLQFIQTKFPAGAIVYRNSKNQAVIALAESGIHFRRDGQKNGASGLSETQGVWTSELQHNGDWIIGNPIDPANGGACPKPIRLATSDWTEILHPGDPVLDIHIPASGPLTAHECTLSTQRAVAFFWHHFPEKPPAKALICTSWILDAQLVQYLKPDSNIINFQQQFYLYPGDCDPWAIFRDVFQLAIPYGQVGGVDLKALPQNSTLEKGVVTHVANGQRWRKAGGFILVEDLPWGRASYRQSNARPTELTST